MNGSPQLTKDDVNGVLPWRYLFFITTVEDVISTQCKYSDEEASLGRYCFT